MDKKTEQEKQAELDKKNALIGSIHLSCFLILIISGIVVKRYFGHPEFMMLFHGPAAVFLVVGGMKVTEKNRRRFNRVKIPDIK